MAKKVIRTAQNKEKGVFSFLTEEGLSAKFNALVGTLRVERKLRNKTFLKTAFNNKVMHDVAKRLLWHAEHSTVFEATHEAISKMVAFVAWRMAFKSGKFSRCAWALQRVFNAVRRFGKLKQTVFPGDFKTPYEARIDRLTPGLRLEDIESVRADLIPVRDQLIGTPAPYAGPKFPIPKEKQLGIMKEVLADLGMNKDNMSLHHGDMHPLALFFDDKVHITFRIDDENPLQNILDVMHEAGHALFRLHMPADVADTYAGHIDMMYNGIDESSAMFFEYYVCHSKEFIEYLHTKIKKHVPDITFTKDDIHSYMKRNVDSLNRASSSPKKYPLFALATSDVERAIIDEGVPVKKAEDLYEAAIHDTFGMTTKDRGPSERVYQSPHWASGEVGRFASGYLVGALGAAQLYDHMQYTCPNAIKKVKGGDFSGVIEYCKKAIYTRPRYDDFHEFFEEVTGEPFSAKPFLRANNIVPPEFKNPGLAV